MTSDEFDQWSAYHTRRFPGIEKWLLGMPDKGDDAIAAWRITLGLIPLDAAKRASDEMHADANLQPPYERHPALVRDLARKHMGETRRYIDGEATRCGLCDDQRFVLIWQPRLVSAIRCTLSERATDEQRAEAEAAIDRYRRSSGTCAIRCTCRESAGCYAGPDGQRVYDPDRHIRVGLHDPQPVPKEVRYGKGLFRGVKHDTMRAWHGIDDLVGIVARRRELASATNGTEWTP